MLIVNSTKETIMASPKTELKIITVTGRTENDKVITEAKITKTPRYRMVPVDMQTFARLMTLCNTYGFGQRGQGAMVRKLVNNEFEKIKPPPSTPNL